jgi:hypothetical protein
MPPIYEEVLDAARKLSREERRQLLVELEQLETASQPNKPRSLLDAFSERGLVGFMTDGPGDLSTNPIHMEGFGRDDR